MAKAKKKQEFVPVCPPRGFVVPSMEGFAGGVLIEVPLAMLEPSRLQCRTQMGDMDALTASIKAHGVHTPLKARPVSPEEWANWVNEVGTGRKNFGIEEYFINQPGEIVEGHRRRIAAERAGKDTVPVFVWNWSDTEALQLQASSNLDQEHYHPLDEAYLYDALLDEHGGDLDRVALSVSRTRSHVERTLVLMKAHKKVQEALLSGELDVTVAKAIARIPSEARQLEALGEVRPFTPQQALSHIVRRFMLRLADAPFETDRVYTGEFGKMAPCTTCQSNTAVQRDLFADVSEDAALCTERECYDAKSAAAWERRSDAALAAGTKVVDVGEGRKFLPGGMPEKAGFVALDGTAVVDVEGSKSWRRVLGEVAPQDIILVRDESGHAIELVTLDFARSRVGKGATDPKVPDDPGKEKAREAEAKKRDKERIQQRQRAMAAIVSADFELALATPVRNEVSTTRIRHVARALVAANARDAGVAIVKRRGLDSETRTVEEALLAEVERLDPASLLALTVELSMHRRLMTCTDAMAAEICEAWGVDWATLKPTGKGKKARLEEGTSADHRSGKTKAKTVAPANDAQALLATTRETDGGDPYFAGRARSVAAKSKRKSVEAIGLPIPSRPEPMAPAEITAASTPEQQARAEYLSTLLGEVKKVVRAGQKRKNSFGRGELVSMVEKKGHRSDDVAFIVGNAIDEGDIIVGEGGRITLPSHLLPGEEIDFTVLQ